MGSYSLSPRVEVRVTTLDADNLVITILDNIEIRRSIENGAYYERITTVVNLRNYFRSQCSVIFS